MKINKILFLIIILGYLNAENMEFIANEIHKSQDIVVAQGEVLLYSKSYLIRADLAVYDQESKIVELFDNVSMIRNDDEILTTNYAKMNLQTNEVTTNDSFVMDKDKEIWLQSENFCSTDERLQADKSIVSSCNVEDPDWHIEYSSGYLNRQTKFLHLFNPVFYGNFPLIGNVPIFYLPYFGFSIDQTRRTGFLTPKVHYSKDEGLGYEQPFYLALQDEWDIELNPQIRTNRGAGIFTTLRFVDSPYSQGFIRLGLFKDKTSYAEEEKLKNKDHKGIEINYQRDKLAKFVIDKDYSEGLYLNFTHLNDIDYLNLQNDSSTDAYDALVHSKLNYFINAKEHYFGLYADYYINTAKIGTKYANKDTMQELPSLQYHSYFDSFLKKNLTYSFDMKFHNYTRQIGITAREFELNAPIGINYSLLNGAINASWTQNFYGAYVDYTNNYNNSLNKTKNTNDKYIRHWQEIALSTDLARAYENDLFHTINLKVSYLQHGYKYGDITKKLYAYDKIEPEDNFIEEVNESYQKKSVNAAFVQYLFSKNNKILHHLIDTSFFADDGRFDTTNNKIDLYFNNLTLFSRLSYDHQNRFFSSAQHGFSANFANFDADLRHTYSKRYTDNDIKSVSNYLQASGGYRFDNFVRIFGAYAYDYERNYTKMWQAGIEQNRKCWSYGLTFRHNTTPVNTSAGPKSSSKENIFLYFTFYPFGDFDYDFSLKSQDFE